jgi:predicted ATP-grasp superfamily ATP-dependent carboligase
MTPYSEFSKDAIIMPIGEDIIIELAKNRNKYQFTPAFPEYSVLELAFNKKKLIDRAVELNVPCPETFSVEDDLAFEEISGKLKFPVVIKPVRSKGGNGISFVDSPDRLKEIYDASLTKFGPLLIQEKIPYKERYSVAILMNSEQVMKRCCVLHAKRFHPISNGPASFVETVNKPQLLELGKTLLESIGYSGIAEIEFVIDSRTNEPKLMEINPRFWGSLQLAINAGVDFPSLLSELVENGDVDKSLNYKTGIRCRHLIFDDTFRLLTILKGPYAGSFKIKSIADFLTFHPDDGYYVFSLDDLKPFRHHIWKKLRSQIN